MKAGYTGMKPIRKYQRQRERISSLNANVVFNRNPWMIIWWTAAFPGFGHILSGIYIKGFLLMFWEFFANLKSNMNLAIVYSFTGHFEEAKNVMDKGWLLIYAIGYVYCIWECSHLSLYLSKFSILARGENALTVPLKMNDYALNYSNKKSPGIAALWSVILPGTGQLYCRRGVTGLVILAGWITASCFSNFFEALYFTLNGSFSQALNAADPEWLLFMPSIFCFAFYDAYEVAVEYNMLFDREQFSFLKGNYQDAGFVMPI